MLAEFDLLQGKRPSPEEVNRRIEHVKRIVVTYPQYMDVWNTLTKVHQRSKGSVNAAGMFIYGDTGVGKSTLLQAYVKQYPREELPTFTRIPALYVRVPSPARTTKALSTEILFRMGDPMYASGTEQVQTTRICHYVERCQIELIVIDEFQHLIDRETDKVFTAASDWVKTLAETINIPVVLCGLSESDRIFKYNKQLDDRYTNRKSLEAFGYWDSGEKAAFHKFLDFIDQRLPFAMRSYLASEDIAARTYYATLGVHRQIKTLLMNATEHAAEDGCDQILMEHLRQGYEDISRSKRDFAVNPFIYASFNLTAAMEEEKKHEAGLQKEQQHRTNRKKVH
jgi:hypothetical protein